MKTLSWKFDFKDKFNSTWKAKYLVYKNHYGLAALPSSLRKIMKNDIQLQNN